MRPQSSASHASSAGSRGSGKRYKTLSRQSEVDESLFGSGASRQGRHDGPVWGGSNRGGTMKENPFETDNVVISRSDLLRIKAASLVTSAEEEERIRKEAEEHQLQQQAEARARKAKMLQLEEQRKKRAAKSDLELEQEENDKTTVARAQKTIDEELDDVKHMNQMMLYSKCVTIRDAQIKEKLNLAKDQETQEKRLDVIMEIERQKQLEIYEEREKKRLEDRKKGAEVIVKQIEERERERIRQLEIQDQEREAMMQQIEEMKREEAQAAEAKRAAGRRLLEEVSKANNEQITRKQAQIEAERLEDLRIATYLEEQEKKLAKELEEKEKIKAEKEKEVARLRAMQEKAQDKQAELDALRAKRAMEQNEREWRRKEMENLKRIEVQNKELARAREQQKRYREMRLAEQALQEKAEFGRIIRAQQAQEEQERRREEEARRARLNHSSEIRSQIEGNVDHKTREREAFLEEGVKQRKAREMEVRRLELIKERKLAELRGQGVPEKYLSELARKKVGV